jgi:hypothetical protein
MKITDPSENKYLHGNLNFALGTSVPLNIFKDSLKIVKYAIESNFYIHTSITYPANAFIFKYFIPKKLKDKAKLITKILGDSPEFLIENLELFFKRFGKKNIEIVQITNLPIKKNGLRNLENLDNQKYSEIVKIINQYKIDKKINKVFLQLYSDDDIKLIEKVASDFDGFVIRGSKEEIFTSEKIYSFLNSRKVPLIIFSIFKAGKGTITKENNYYNNTFNFFTQNFNNDLILVGRTSNFNRIKSIYNSINNMKAIEKKINPNFSSVIDKQEVSKLVLNYIIYSGIFHSLKIILKDLIKKLIKYK